MQRMFSNVRFSQTLNLQVKQLSVCLESVSGRANLNIFSGNAERPDQMIETRLHHCASVLSPVSSSFQKKKRTEDGFCGGSNSFLASSLRCAEFRTCYSIGRSFVETPHFSVRRAAQHSSSSRLYSSLVAAGERNVAAETVLSGGVCPGCGIGMQHSNPQAPGYFQVPVDLLARTNDEEEQQENVDVSLDEVQLPGDTSDNDEEAGSDEALKTRRPRIRNVRQESFEGLDDNVDNRYEIAGLSSKFWKELGGVRRGSREGPEKANLEVESDEQKLVVCARCHALRNYGRVKDESLENLLPDFDFERVIGARLRRAIGRRAVVVMVVDCLDFDGSFPIMAATLLAEADRDIGGSWREGASGNVPRLVIALNKADLLPGGISPVRLEQWVRRRARAGGVAQLSGVHIVSALKGWGMEQLSKRIVEMAGPRGDVWVIGAQNAGKSSLINSLAKLTPEGSRKAHLTEAAVPGTTLGILKLEGILPDRARVLDTPGLLHPHQITTRLTREEQKMVQIRKVLKPRTFRVKATG